MFPWPPQDPESLLSRLQDEMQRVVERLWHTGVSTRPFDGQSWAPLIDVYELADGYRLYVEAPGVKPNEIEVSQVAGSLTIRGRKEPPLTPGNETRLVRAERRYGDFSRTVELPGDVDAKRISARFADGILEITVPKSEAAKPKSVKIQVEPT
jgi:HSP20 family protein